MPNSASMLCKIKVEASHPFPPSILLLCGLPLFN